MQQMPALGDEPIPAEITMSMRGAKGTHTAVRLDNRELEVTSQSWIYATWKDTDFSACTRKMSRYPESAVEEEPICRGSGPQAGPSFSICRSHISGVESDRVQTVDLPIISGTLSKTLNLSEKQESLLVVVPGKQCSNVSSYHFYTICFGNFLLAEAVEREGQDTLSLILKPRIGTGVYEVLRCRVEAGTDVQATFLCY